MSSRLLDLLERTGWTFVQAALAVWIATDLDLWSVDALKVAATAGVIAAAKCVIAFQVGSDNTAATLPAREDTDLGGDEGAGGVDLFFYVLAGFVAVVLVLVLLRAFG